MLSPETRQQALIQTPPVLPALAGLFEALDRRGIRYCHWKSNLRLGWGLAGRTDLDLLVDPEYERPFKLILGGLGIKPLLAPVSKRYPGLEHYLGFDPQTGRLFHLHVHFALVLGEQFVKNYTLPLEKHFLHSSRPCCGVEVPAPELELIVLVLRALLKYRDRDGIKDILGIRSPGIPEHILDEITWLLEGTSIEQVEAALPTLPLDIRPKTVTAFLETVRGDPRDGRRLLRLRSQVRRALRPYQRRSRLISTLKYFQVLAQKIFIQRARPDKQMSLPGRGLTVALVGVDGAGKSTLAGELSRWLRWKLDAPLHYLGSKQPSVWTNWSYILFRAMRRGHREASAILSEDNLIAKTLLGLRQTFLALHHLSVGHDRVGRYRRGVREAGRGSVVVFDRFPFASPLDGPEIQMMDGGRLVEWMAKVEQRLYRRFEPVDLLVVLEASPEVSLRRKPDHAPETIRAKGAALAALKSRLETETGWDWVALDADAPLDDVLLQLKGLVWAAL